MIFSLDTSTLKYKLTAICGALFSLSACNDQESAPDDPIIHCGTTPNFTVGQIFKKGDPVSTDLANFVDDSDTYYMVVADVKTSTSC